jgi:hypothetical protein
MLAILQSVGLAQLKAHISPSSYALVSGLLAAANQVSIQLGGPQI